MKPPPDNLVHIALAELDPTMLTDASAGFDNLRIDVSVRAVAKLLADPPPMINSFLIGDDNK